MAQREPTRREYLVLEAVNPLSGKMTSVQISYSRIQNLGRRSRGQTMECAHIVPFVLQFPKAVFEGIRSENDEDRDGGGWLCYCGVPTVSYRTDGTEQNPFPNQVYLVFVNDQGVAYNWRWENADPDDHRLPENWETRFKKKWL